MIPFFLRKRHRRTDGPTNGRTDMLGYRDARTHLKRRRKVEKIGEKTTEKKKKKKKTKKRKTKKKRKSKTQEEKKKKMQKM